MSDLGKQLLGATRSISAHLLVDQIEPASLRAFLETVLAHSVALGWEIKIHDGQSISNIVLNGSQTPAGILVFATLIPQLVTLQEDRSAPPDPVAVSARPADETDTPEPLANAIHDLRNPISSILSACEYLAEYSQDNLNPEQLQMISEIALSAGILRQLSDRIAELINRYDDSETADSGSSQ